MSRPKVSSFDTCRVWTNSVVSVVVDSDRLKHFYFNILTLFGMLCFLFTLYWYFRTFVLSYFRTFVLSFILYQLYQSQDRLAVTYRVTNETPPPLNDDEEMNTVNLSPPLHFYAIHTWPHTQR